MCKTHLIIRSPNKKTCDNNFPLKIIFHKKLQSFDFTISHHFKFVSFDQTIGEDPKKVPLMLSCCIIALILGACVDYAVHSHCN